MKSEFDEKQFESVYSDGVENTYWSLSRNYIIRNSIKKNNLDKNKIIEIGCGRGIVVKYLRDRGIHCKGVELSVCKPIHGISDFIKTGMDANDLPLEERSEFKSFMLLDVIEHIENPVEFLKNILDRYRNLTSIIIAVPARQEIWSNYDEFYGHYRRYDLQMTKDVIDKIGFEVIENRYFFHALFNSAKFVFHFNKTRNTQIVPPKGFSKILHKIIAGYFILEYFLLPKHWKGSSIICVAHKKTKLINE